MLQVLGLGCDVGEYGSLDLRLRVAEGKITGWIDKKMIFNVPIKGHTFDIWWEQAPMRPLGIGTWNTSAALRNFKLLKLKPAADTK